MGGVNTKVEQLFNDFILGSGGQLVSSLVTKDHPLPNADYYFHDHGIVGELKCLQQHSFNATYAMKLQKLVDSWMQRRLFMAYGRVQIDLQRLNPICQREWMNLIGDSLQKRFVEHANRQIRETKGCLVLQMQKGILFISSDGNSSLQPYDLMFFLDRTLKKKKNDDASLFKY
jgi:hypothetical protein